MDTEEKVNILLVDDSPTKLIALESILADLGQNLVEARSGKEALRQLLQQEFAVILLDVMMPGMDGFETAELIRQRERSQYTPIIFVTAFGTTEVDRARGYRLGAVDYMFTPVVPEILKAKVTVFVELFKKTRQVQIQAGQLRSLNEKLETQLQEVERLNRRLQIVNKELETFSYSVSHDLKAPLRGMDGFAQALQEEYAGKLNDTGRHYLDMICGSARRMGILIDDLLKYSRLERRPMQWQTVDLKRLIQDLIAERQVEIDKRGVRIDLSLPFQQIACEREGVQQVLANLLDNALKFTRPTAQPAITIRAEEGNAERVVQVADNGIGFHPDYQEKIFAIFQRLHAQDEYEGTGIGLAIVKKVAERHGGRAWAESEPGKGATFYFAIPKQEREPGA
jgi:signal transduction histidine kinase